MNSCSFTGNLGKDPVVKSTQTGKMVAMFSLATQRYNADPNAKPVSDWINVVAWGGLATAVQQSLHKGSYVWVHGRSQTRSYEDSKGEKKYVTEIVADNIAVMLKRSNEQNQPFNAQQFGQPTRQYQQGNVFQQRDEDIPF